MHFTLTYQDDYTIHLSETILSPKKIMIKFNSIVTSVYLLTYLTQSQQT